MTPSEFAQKAAEEVLRSIEYERAIIKARIAEVIERVYLQSPLGQPSSAGVYYSVPGPSGAVTVAADAPATNYSSASIGKVAPDGRYSGFKDTMGGKLVQHIRERKANIDGVPPAIMSAHKKA